MTFYRFGIKNTNDKETEILLNSNHIQRIEQVDDKAFIYLINSDGYTVYESSIEYEHLARELEGRN